VLFFPTGGVSFCSGVDRARGSFGEPKVTPPFLVYTLSDVTSREKVNMLKHLLFWLLLLAPSSANGQADWSWIGGDVKPSGWATVQGSADVDLKGGRLDAKLYMTDGTKPAQTLKGSIASGQVKAVRRIFGSDIGDETMTGTYARMQHGDSIYEAIILQTQWGFIGITRTVQVR